MKNTYFALLFILISFAAQAQKITVTGRVLGAAGEALPGSTVLERGTSNGTSTGSTGEFTLTVAPAATITVQAIGFATQQISLNGRTSLDVRLVAAAQDLTEVVVTGSRATEGRSNILTTAPVDVISAREIKAFAQTDVAQVLSFVAPSFQSARQTISDGTDHIDPASLRGLGPDQVLVLVNGKRRHASSLVNVNGTVGRGSVGTDLNVIPAAAIKRIEVLRDGAAAQYGSDAIAGVINIQLKDDTTGVNVSTTAGQTVESDGHVFQADANVGFGLGGRGFINLSGQYVNRGYTNRSGEDTAPLLYFGDNGGNYPGTANTPALRQALKARDDARAAAAGYDRRNLRFGNSDSRNYGFFLNGGFDLAPGFEAYLAGGITQRDGKAAGFARLPGRYSAQNDSLMYPNGFLPFIEPTINDRSLIAGVRGKVAGFDFDLANTYGLNSLDYRVTNSLNASLPAGSGQRSFYGGQLFASQNSTTLGFVRKLSDVGPLTTLNVAFGGEFRSDNFQIAAGEPTSYSLGLPGSGTSRRVNTGPTSTGLAAAGAQVFPGYQPTDVLNRSRTNVAGYLDLESDIGSRLLVGLAGRAENYSDFGSNISGKASARFSILDNLAVRGAISNGFRAPSLQQRYFTSTSTQFVQGVPQTVLTASNENPIVAAFGVGSLKQETSINYSVGLAGRIARTLTFTVDAYQIDLKDRIVLSTQFNRFTNATVETILTNAGLTRAGNGAGIVQFFANAVDTRTRGLDVVVNDRLTLGTKGSLTLTAAANFTETTVTSVNVPSTLVADEGLRNTFFDRQQRGRLESAQPNSKIVLSGGYTIGKFGLQLRTVRFGEVRFYDARLNPAPTPEVRNSAGAVTSIAVTNPVRFSDIDQTFGAKWVTDATVNFQLLKPLGIAVGANNIFNVYPDKYRVNPRNSATNFSVDPSNSPAINGGNTAYASNLDNTNRGRTLYNPNQFGFNGAFYFVRLNYTL